MEFIINNWMLMFVLGTFTSLLIWGLIAMSNADFKRRDEANRICEEFENRIDDANTLDELIKIEDELFDGYTTPNPFKDDSVFIKLNNPERVKIIMLFLKKKIKWVRYNEKQKGNETS